MPKADFLYAYRPKMNNASFFDRLVGWNHHSGALYPHTYTYIHTQTYIYIFWDIHIPFEFTILFLDIYPNAIIKYVKRGMHVDVLHDTSTLVYNFLNSVIQSQKVSWRSKFFVLPSMKSSQITGKNNEELHLLAWKSDHSILLNKK